MKSWTGFQSKSRRFIHAVQSPTKQLFAWLFCRDTRPALRHPVTYLPLVRTGTIAVTKIPSFELEAEGSSRRHRQQRPGRHDTAGSGISWRMSGGY